MSFKPVLQLGNELKELAGVSAKADPDLFSAVATFVTEIARLVDLAFSDVHDVLREVAFLPPSEINPDRIAKLQGKIAAIHAKEKFKNVLNICAQLAALAKTYEKEIAPRLEPDNARHHSQLLWLLDQHEGAFIDTIRSATREINAILDRYETGASIDEARRHAREALASLEDGTAAIQAARNEVIVALPGGSTRLLSEERTATEILRRSPWFSGSFYLAAALLLLTALTIVAGNVEPYALPLVIAGTYAGLTIIAAFQLSNDGRLSEAGLLRILDLSMRRVLLPLSRRRS